MSSGLSVWLRRACLVIAVAVTLVAALFVVDQFLPHRVSFGTEDLESRARYEAIVTAHGYKHRHDKDVHGATVVVIDRITDDDAQKIRCEHDAWNAQRLQQRGVVTSIPSDCVARTSTANPNAAVAPKR